MKSAPHRLTALMVVLILVLTVCTVWAWSQMTRSHTAARQAAEDVRTCANLIQQIEILRNRPTVAGSEEMQMNQLAKQIEQAAVTANLPMDSIVRIWPEPARRVADSAYKEKPTQVLLRNIQLRQLMAFLHTLSQTGGSSDMGGLEVRSIRLTAPRQETGNSWTAEATLTYLIYSPANTPIATQ